MTPEQDLARAVIDQTEKLADSLRTAMGLLAPLRPVTGERLARATDEETALIDAFALRFARLQDMLGQKVFRAALTADLAPIPSSTIDLLGEVERRGILDSVERWKILRDLRNGMTHDYHDKPALAATVLEHALTEADHLLDIQRRATAFIAARLKADS